MRVHCITRALHVYVITLNTAAYQNPSFEPSISKSIASVVVAIHEKDDRIAAMLKSTRRLSVWRACAERHRSPCTDTRHWLTTLCSGQDKMISTTRAMGLEPLV